MRQYLALLFFLCSAASSVAEAKNPVGLVCTYDYNTTLQQDDINAFDASTPIKLSYVVSRKGVDSTELEPHNSLEQMVKSYAKSRNLLVYVHGDHSLLSTLLANGSKFADTYDNDLLMFIWPSNSIENRTIQNYKQSKHNTMAVLSSFARTVDSLSHYCAKYDINCTLMFHSLGNLFAKNFVRYFVQHSALGRLAINNVLLNAACVWENDHDIWVDLLAKRIGGKVFITQNRSDRILALASDFIEYGDLLGMTSPTVRSANAIYMDFTDVLKRKADTYESHGYYLGPILDELPQIRRFYQSVFNFEPVSFLSDSALYSNERDNNIFKVVLPGK